MVRVYNNRQKYLLRALKSCKHQNILKVLTDLISDICNNIVAGNTSKKITPPMLKQLKKHKQSLLYLADKKKPLDKRIKILNQSGGAILSLILLLISGLLSNLIQ